MFHFVYKTTHTSGKYYIGRHSTEDIEDGYLGSGRWVKSIKDKSSLSREILHYYKDTDELIENETKIIQENIDHPLCMNWNDRGVGWSSKYNPSKLNPQRMAGDKNPMKKEVNRKKVSEAHKEAYRTGKRKPSHLGKCLSEETKRRISEAKRGTKRSPEAIEKTRQANIGRKQTDYQKQKAREANEKVWKVITPDGTEEIITNLRQYSLERGLDPGNMMHVARGRQHQHKGYKVSKMT
jgi:hypothetical protein